MSSSKQAQLVSLIYEHTQQSSTFDQAWNAFASTFSRDEWADLLQCLKQLLQDSRVLQPDQRLLASYLVHHATTHDLLLATQFRKTILQLATDTSSSLAERTLLCQLLLNAASSVCEDSPHAQPQVAHQTPLQFVTAHQSTEEAVTSHGVSEAHHASGSACVDHGGGQACGTDDFSQQEHLINTLHAAAQAPLLPGPQQQLLVSVAQHAQQLALHPDLPLLTPGLVRHNPTVALAVLQANVGGAQFAQHLTLLLLAPPTVRSVEVVAQLASVAELPEDFLQAYILTCLDACAAERETQQTRLARLVCVFIQGLLHRQSLDVLQVHLELQSFCIEYVRLREAAELYRELRELF